MENQETLNRFVIGIQINGGDKLKKLLDAVKQVDAVSKKLNNTNKKGAEVTAKSSQAIKTIGDTFTYSERRINSFNKTMVASFRSQKNEIADVVRRVALWSGALGALFGTISKIKQVYSTTLDLQVAMAELHKVMGDYKPYRKMKKEIFDMAQQYSSAAKDAFDIAKIWAQQGKTMADVIKLTGLALRGVNSANLSAAQSVEFLTSVTKTYNLEASKTYSVLDGIMKVQANYAITAQNLARGFMVTGKAAQVMGDDIGTVMGMITAIGQITRETGNVIGNSLKTQFSRLSKPSTLQYLEGLGIKTRSPKGNVLNARTIYSQIAAKWKGGELPTEISNVARKIGGVRKYKDVLVLLDQWQVAEQARMKYLKAYGDASKASAVLQDTLRKKMEKFNTILVNLGDNILEQTLIPAFSSLMDVLNGVGSVLRNITESSAGGLGMSMVLGMGGVGIVNAIRNKFAQGRMTDMMRNLEMTTAMRTSGVVGRNVITPYEGMFGLMKQTPIEPLNIKMAASKFQSAQKENIKIQQQMTNTATNTYQQYLNNFEQINRAAAKFGPQGQIIIRNAMAQMMATSMRESGVTGKWSAFFRGMKWGAVGQRPLGSEEKLLRYASFGQSVTNFGKSVLKFGLISLAIESAVYIVTKIAQWYTRKSPKIDLSSSINPNSDISQDFVSLAKGFKSVQDAAAAANKSIEEYIKDSPNIYKNIINKIVKPVGNELMNGVLLSQKKAIPLLDKQGDVIAYKIKKPLTTLEQLMASFRKHGLAVKDYNDALRVQMVIYKFIGNEILKQKKKLTKAYMDVKNKVVEKIVKQGPRAFGFEPQIHKIGTGGIYTTYEKYNINDFAKRFTSDFSSQIRKEFKGQKFNISKLFAYVFESGGEEDKKIAKKMIDDAIWKTAQRLAGKAPTLQAATSYVRTKEQTDKEYLKSITLSEYNAAIKKNIDIFVKTTDEYKQWSKYLTAYGKNMGNAVDDVTNLLYMFAAGLISAKDKIFEVINQYDMDLKKIKANEQLFNITGVRKSSAQDRLTAFRKAMSGLAVVAPNMDKKYNTVYNQFDRIINVLNNKIPGVNVDDLNNLKKAIMGGKKSEALKIADTINTAIEQAKSEGRSESPVYKKIQSFFKLLADTTADKFVNYGGIVQSSATFSKLLNKHGKEWGMSEKDMRKYAELISKGSFSEAAQIINKHKNIGKKILASAIYELVIDSFKDIDVNFKSKKRELQNKLNTIFFEGTALDKIKMSGVSNINNIISDYNDRINRERQRITEETVPVDLKNISVKIQQLQAQKEVNVEIEKNNMLLDAYQEQLAKIDNALESFKQSTVVFLSDINTYNFKDQKGFNQSMKNWIGEMSSTVMQNSITGLGDAIFNGKGGRKIASILLGEKLPEKPKLSLKDLALDNNTKAINANTMAIIEDIRSRGGNVTGLYIPKTTPAITTKAGGKYSVDGIYHSPDTGTWFDKKTKDLKFSRGYYFARAMGDIGGSITGNLMASKSKRSNDMVGLGTMGGNALAALLFSGSSAAAFGLPLLFGGIAGLFGTKINDGNRKIEDELKKINDNNKKIVENTAPLKAVDSRLINAPANFVLPSLAKAGGSAQYINITIHGASDPEQTANAVRKVFEDNYNFNNVSSNI